MSGGSEDELHRSLSSVPAVSVEEADEARDLLCRSSGPSSAGGRRAPVSRVEGEGALPPLGDEEVAVLKVAKAEGAVVAFGDATGCVREDN